jgi:anti-anti-sigma regulatory factor
LKGTTIKTVPIRAFEISKERTLATCIRAKMGIQSFSEDILLVTLPEQPQRGDELDTITQIAGDQPVYDVVVDFSKVEMLVSESIRSLMILERLLSGVGHRLILCNVPSEIRGILARVGLEALFEFSDDEFQAMQFLRRASSFYG